MTVNRFEGLELSTLSGPDFNEDKSLVVQPERVNITGHGENKGLYFYTYQDRGPFFMEQSEAEKLRDALVQRYGVPPVIDNGPVNAFTVFCDVDPDEFLRVEASDGQIYLAIEALEGDVQLDLDTARGLADGLQQLIDDIENGVVEDAEQW